MLIADYPSGISETTDGQAPLPIPLPIPSGTTIPPQGMVDRKKFDTTGTFHGQVYWTDCWPLTTIITNIGTHVRGC